MNSWCSRCALLTSATVGCGDRGQVARSRPDGSCPARPPPARCAPAQAQQRQRQADVVVQVALRRQRRVADCQARRIDAIICVTVVLPLLPVTAISGSVEAARARRAASSPSASCVSATSRPAGRRRQRPRSASAATAPLACASARKSWASKRSPLQRDEQVARLQRARVGVHALRRRRAPSPTSVAPRHPARSACGQREHHRSCGAPRAPARPPHATSSENGLLARRAISW